MSDNGTAAPGAQPLFKEITDKRLQLLQNGYSPLPVRGKAATQNGWNRASTEQKLRPAHIEKTWPRDALGTGIRIVDRLVAIDIDVDDAIAGDILDMVGSVAGEVLQRAPMRYGHSEHKVALFCALEEGSASWRRISTYKFRRGNEEASHQVEIFGGVRSRNGDCLRQFVVDGPHPDGGRYEFTEGPTVFDTRPEALPRLSIKQAFEIAARAEAILEGAGFAKIINSKAENGNRVYDITAETVFTLQTGEEVDYAGLCDTFASADAELRCSTSFLPGRDGSRADHCIVGDRNREGVVAVYVYGDDMLHLPAELKPVDMENVTATLAQAVEAGLLPKPKPAVPLFEMTEKGGVRLCMYNAVLAIEADGLHCRHDVFHNMTRIEGPKGAKWVGEVTDSRIRALRMRLHECFRVDFNDRHTNDAVLYLADKNRFNPVLDMLAEAQAGWDGVKRIDKMAEEIFHCGKGRYASQALRKVMIAAVRRVRQPGCKFDTMPLFISPQGWDKSTAWRILAGDENFSEAQIIGANAREVMEGLAGVWIHENAELAGMGKRDVEVVKDYCSRQVDKARPAYGRHVEIMPRHSIEIGTTNETKALLDSSGNRRFWPLTVAKPIDTDRLRWERLQYWGEAATIEATGESLVLDRDLWDEAGAAQEAARLRDPWEDILDDLTRSLGGSDHSRAIIHFDEETGLEMIRTASLLEHTLKDSRPLSNPMVGKRLNSVLRTLGWTAGRVVINGKRSRGYYRKAAVPVRVVWDSVGNQNKPGSGTLEDAKNSPSVPKKPK